VISALDGNEVVAEYYVDRKGGREVTEVKAQAEQRGGGGRGEYSAGKRARPTNGGHIFN